MRSRPNRGMYLICTYSGMLQVNTRGGDFRYIGGLSAHAAALPPLLVIPAGQAGRGAAWRDQVTPSSCKEVAFRGVMGDIARRRSPSRMPHVHASAASELQRALDTLRGRGQRLTKPRRAILEVLTREHGPFTTEELHARLEGGLCDLVTVYRCLAALEEVGLARRCDFGDGSYRYEFDSGEHHHHHVICRHCRSVKTLDLCVADSLERMVRQMGYADVNHTLEIFGVCPKCQGAAAGASTRKAEADLTG
jgi:Fur family ferric uptake transcriptional regulator